MSEYKKTNQAIAEWVGAQECNWLKVTYCIKHCPSNYKVSLRKYIKNSLNMVNSRVYGKKFKRNNNRKRLKCIFAEAGSINNGIHNHIHGLIEIPDSLDITEFSELLQRSFAIYSERDLKHIEKYTEPNVWTSPFDERGSARDSYIYYILRNENDNFGSGSDKVVWDITYLEPTETHTNPSE